MDYTIANMLFENFLKSPTTAKKTIPGMLDSAMTAILVMTGTKIDSEILTGALKEYLTQNDHPMYITVEACFANEQDVQTKQCFSSTHITAINNKISQEI